MGDYKQHQFMLKYDQQHLKWFNKSYYFKLPDL